MSFGWFRAHRRLFDVDHPLGEDQPVCARFAWLDLCGMATHTPELGLDRGQVRVSTRYLAKRWRWSQPRVRRWMDKIETMGMIRVATLERSRAGSIVTVTNYEKYQSRLSGPAQSKSMTNKEIDRVLTQHLDSVPETDSVSDSVHPLVAQQLNSPDRLSQRLKGKKVEEGYSAVRAAPQEQATRLPEEGSKPGVPQVEMHDVRLNVAGMQLDYTVDPNEPNGTPTMLSCETPRELWDLAIEELGPQVRSDAKAMRAMITSVGIETAERIVRGMGILNARNTFGRDNTVGLRILMHQSTEDWGRTIEAKAIEAWDNETGGAA